MAAPFGVRMIPRYQRRLYFQDVGAAFIPPLQKVVPASRRVVARMPSTSMHKAGVVPVPFKRLVLAMFFTASFLEFPPECKPVQIAMSEQARPVPLLA